MWNSNYGKISTQLQVLQMTSCECENTLTSNICDKLTKLIAVMIDTTLIIWFISSRPSQNTRHLIPYNEHRATFLCLEFDLYHEQIIFGYYVSMNQVFQQSIWKLSGLRFECTSSKLQNDYNSMGNSKNKVGLALKMKCYTQKCQDKWQHKNRSHVQVSILLCVPLWPLTHKWHSHAPLSPVQIPGAVSLFSAIV